MASDLPSGSPSKLVSVSLWHVPIILGWWWALAFFPAKQGAPGLSWTSVPQPWNQRFLPGALVPLVGNGTRDQELDARGAHCYWVYLLLDSSSIQPRKYMHGHIYIYTCTYRRVYMYMCTQTSIFTYILMSSYWSLQIQSIPIGLFPAFPYSIFISIFCRVNCSSQWHPCIYSFLHPIIYQKLFQNSFAHTTTRNKPSKEGSVFVRISSPTLPWPRLRICSHSLFFSFLWFGHGIHINLSSLFQIASNLSFPLSHFYWFNLSFWICTIFIYLQNSKLYKRNTRESIIPSFLPPTPSPDPS